MLTAALSSPTTSRQIRSSAATSTANEFSSSINNNNDNARNNDTTIAENNEETSSTPLPHIRIVPHLDSPRSLVFGVIERDVQENAILKIGRFTERFLSPNRITFRSKVVSRGHAEIWTEGGKVNYLLYFVSFFFFFIYL